DDEEQVDYVHDDTNVYLTEPEDAGDACDIGDDEPNFGAMGEVAPSLFSTGGHFESVVDFEGASGALESTPAIDTTEAPVPAPVSLVWWRLIISELQDAIQEKDAMINEAKAAFAAAQVRLEVAQRQKEELELSLSELAKKWDSQIAELQDEMKKL
ncbi:uncharacterized protein A4U43_C05F19460, partial [Asparagus officinalis]